MNGLTAKRVLVATVLVLCSMGMVGCSLFSKPPKVPAALTWDYKSIDEGALPTDFIIKKGVPAVYEAPLGDLKAVRLRKEGGTADGFLVPFSRVTGEVVVEFAAYIPTEERNIVVIVGPREEGATTLPSNQGVYLSFMADGVLSYYSGGWKELGSFSTDDWHDFRVEVDVPAEAFTVYVNGEELGTGTFRGPVEYVSAVDFSMFDNAAEGTVWIGPISVITP